MGLLCSLIADQADRRFDLRLWVSFLLLLTHVTLSAKSGVCQILLPDWTKSVPLVHKSVTLKEGKILLNEASGGGNPLLQGEKSTKAGKSGKVDASTSTYIPGTQQCFTVSETNRVNKYQCRNNDTRLCYGQGYVQGSDKNVLAEYQRQMLSGVFIGPIVRGVCIWMAPPCIGIYVCFEGPSRLSIFEAGLSDAMGRHRAYKNLAEGFEGTLSFDNLPSASRTSQDSSLRTLVP
ncbi:hypothetical protein WN48_00995 [Eufriesea mexicana]|uniref:Uncharacterized protein n=1 Tax=Eufriesea mexicana TaxID=516756 RepID=A0A310SCY9_9HYME|nr:hypothetical protein WN48_00995 [Eufriesea mexicana]